MKNTLSLCLICFTLIGSFGQKDRHLIYFNSNESALNSKQTRELDSLIVKIQKKPGAKVLLIGHTDSIGSLDANKKLSLSRTLCIESYFVKNGIDKKKIQIEYYAYLFPLASNNKESDRAKNRRTEIVIYTEKELAALDKAKKTQTFYFKDNSKDLKIASRGGAKIRIPAKTLVSSIRSKPVENIRVEITEAYSLSDMIENNFHTLSDQGILETDGMIKIRAFDTNGELSIKKDSVFYMALPTKNKKKNMDLYSMKSDTSKHWSKNELRNLLTMKFVMSFFYGLNGDYGDTAQTNKALRRAFGNNFLDTLNTKANYFSKIEKINYNYNIDKIQLLYNELAYEKLFVSNPDTLRMNYRLILKDIKALYFQNNSDDANFSIDKIKNKKSYLIAFNYDILKNIVQYDVVDVSSKNEVRLNLKTVSAQQYKDAIDKLWN